MYIVFVSFFNVCLCLTYSLANPEQYDDYTGGKKAEE